MIRFDSFTMLNHPTITGLLVAAACGSVLSLGACSSEIKVQRVEYEAPSVAQTTAAQSTTNPTQMDESTQTLLARSQGFTRPESSSDSSPAPLSTLQLAREALEDIYTIDAQLVASTLQQDPNRVHSMETIAEFDRQHAQTLKVIIEHFGWPSREMVGLKAVQGAYIAVQHASHDPAFQSDCLAMIQEQVDQGELPGAFLALMTDRVAVSRGDEQIYGTQMTMAPDEFGVMRAVPAAKIWQAQELDNRRLALGMPSHQRFIEAIELAYFDSIQQSKAQLSSVSPN